jgi:hypothetical protein
MTQKNTLAIIAVLVAVLSVSTLSIALNLAKVQAQEGQTFSATLSGENEVPPTESNATGVAQFQLSDGDDGQEVAYSVNLTGFDDITAAHIHSGNEGENGPIVATLSEGEEADGDSVELQFTGNIQTNDLAGPLEDSEIADLVDLMNNGSAYVNVHTEIYPDGAIRGQITSTSASTDSSASTNATSASESMDNATSTNATSASESMDNATSTNATSASESMDNATSTNATSASSLSTDSPNMDIDESMK